MDSSSFYLWIASATPRNDGEKRFTCHCERSEAIHTRIHFYSFSIVSISSFVRL
ncbi:hypothetical protein [Helicobacter canis]|uniref:hypothetical protein n=1 Tax=Helicobacter canis TaxID=29419 RepID=UPI0015F08E4D|nr:hypothetical protein [Helicobacter canis]